MANRKRSISKQFYINEEEEKLINEKMTNGGFNNFGAYARKMLIDGYVIKTDYSSIKNLNREINKIGVNINQISKRVNETNRIYNEDIEQIKKEFEDIWQLLKLNLLNQN